MIANIVACGPSGAQWDGRGFSIGVNDCRKWGYDVDILIVVNSLDKYPDRKKIVQDSRPRQELLGLGMWSSHPCYKRIGYMNQWKGKLEKGKLYKSKSSPFIAATLAYSLGYDKIVLWGVDFEKHPFIHSERLSVEVANFASLQKELERNGASMYVGQAEGFEYDGALADVLPRWTRVQSTVF